MMPRSLRLFLTLVDMGFLLYWTITALSLLPAEWLYKDAGNTLMVSWNWSFLPLDLAASALGLSAVWLDRRQRPWRFWALLSLSLTLCAGLQALSFWVLRRDFDWAWWIPNLILLLGPLPWLHRLWREGLNPIPC